MADDKNKKPEDETEDAESTNPPVAPSAIRPPASAPDPTRYGDWEINGKCIDF